MPAARSTVSLDSFTTFGELLKYARRRAQITQRDLGIAVGYSEAQISRFEQNRWLPDEATLTALFIPALALVDQPALAARLLALAAAGRAGRPAGHLLVTHTVQHQIQETIEQIGSLEVIPAAPAQAVPRASMLARLKALLEAERRVALIGLAGMGKTTLAAALARQWAKNGAVLWVTLSVELMESAETVIRQLALFLFEAGREEMLPLLASGSGSAPQWPLEQQLALITAALIQAPGLLCLDNAHLMQGAPDLVQLLRHLLAATPAAVLLISREELPLPGLAQLPLAGMEHAEGLALMAQMGPGLPASLAERLLDKTGGSPMLIRLAMGRLGDAPERSAEFIDHLQTQPQVAAYILETALLQLSPPAQSLVDLLAVFRHPVDLYDETLIELSQTALGAFDHRQGLAEIQRRQLIEHPGLAVLPPLVREQRYATLAADAPLRQRLHRAAGEWCERALGNALEAAHHSRQAGDLRRAVELLAGQVPALLTAGQGQAAAELADQILARVRGQAGSAELIRQLLLGRGDLLINSLRAAEAEASYREALGLSSGSAARAEVVARLAQSRLQRSQVAEALEMCQAAEAALQAGQPAEPDHALRLAQLASVACQAHLMLSQHDEAARVAGQALRLLDEISAGPALTAPIEAQARNTLGIVNNIRGQHEAALDHWQRSIEASRQCGLRRLEYRCRMNIGILKYQQNDVASAVLNFQEALAGVRAIGDSFLTARILHNLAFIQHLRGQLPAALTALDEVIAIKRGLGDRQGVLASQNQRAATLLGLGRVAEARETVEQVLVEVDAGSDKRMLGGFLDMLAETQLVLGDFGAAEAALRRALALPGAADDMKLRSDLHNHLALALLAAGDNAAAQATLDQEPAHGGPEIELERLLIIGLLALAQGNLAASADQAQAAAERAQAVGYGLYERAAARLAEAAQQPPPRADFPKILWGGPD